MLYSLQFKIGVHLLNVELLQLLTPAEAKLNYVIELLQKNSNAIAVAARDVKLRQIVAVENQVSFLSFHVTLVQKSPLFYRAKNSLPKKLLVRLDIV